MGEIKYPVLYAERESGEFILHWWWTDEIIMFLDSLPENYPRFTNGQYHEDEMDEYFKAIERLKDEGWNFIEDRTDEVKEFWTRE